MATSAFVCMALESPPIAPFGVTVAPRCDLPAKLAFLAAHKLGLLYAMTLDRTRPLIPTSHTGSHLLAPKEVDLYLGWDGVVRCRVPIHSVVNTAFGWVVVLDAPNAKGVKTPALTAIPRAPEQVPWNAWLAGEKRGKEVGEEQPNPVWLSTIDRVDLDRAIERMREAMTAPVQHLEYALPSIPSRPLPTHTPPVLTLVPPIPPILAIMRPVPAPAPKQPSSPAVVEEYELPFDVEPSSGVRPTATPPLEPPTDQPQLGLF